MDNDAKLRPLYLLKILRDQSDEDHSLTTSDLRGILKENFGMETHRTTIGNDIKLLQDAGFDIDVIHSTQNRYRVLHRDFDTAELKMLVDAVQTFRVIPKHKGEDLVKKITNLAGDHKARELRRTLIVDSPRKQDNSYIFYVVDRIYEAINQQKKIRFQMMEYNARKQQVLHNLGEWYVFSPYTLVWDGDFYYMVGFSDKYSKITSNRVDRIAEIPEILDDPAVPMPKDFDINTYLNTMIHMYDVPRQTVELICHNKTMGSILDKFGMDVSVSPWDDNHFLVRIETAPSIPFYNWIFGFQGLVSIHSPASVQREFTRMVAKTLSDLLDAQAKQEAGAKQEAETQAVQEDSN